MTRLKINQRKVIAEGLVNLSVVLVTSAIISQIIIQKDISTYSLFVGTSSFVFGVILSIFAVNMLK